MGHVGAGRGRSRDSCDVRGCVAGYMHRLRQAGNVSPRRTLVGTSVRRIHDHAMLGLNLSVHVLSMSGGGGIGGICCGSGVCGRVHIISDDFMNSRNLSSRYLLLERMECNREQQEDVDDMYNAMCGKIIAEIDEHGF